MSLFIKKPKQWTNYVQTIEVSDIPGIEPSVHHQLSLMDIDRETLARVRRVGDLLRPHIDEMVQSFYERITAENDLNELINKHSAVDRLKQTMKQYIERFINAEI